MIGTVTLAQESRFQLVDEAGIAHHFILSHAAAAEPFQLGLLQRRQAKVCIHWKEAASVLAKVARRIELCDEDAEAAAT